MNNIRPPSDETVTDFPQKSAIDTCSVWNVLSFGITTTQAVVDSSKIFILPEFVRYECLYKPRSPEVTKNQATAKTLLLNYIRLGRLFFPISMTVDDLRSVAKIRGIRNLGLGEISTIVVSQKIQCGFVTDDGPARALARRIIPNLEIRTSSHLIGWLVYAQRLTETEAQIAIQQHDKMMGKSSNRVYLEACRNHALFLRASISPN
jgi:hypothetical protein